MRRGHLLSKAAKRFSHYSATSQHQRRLQVHHRRLLCEVLEDRRLLSIGCAPVLPGMHLIDPNLDNLRGQIVYLDFDGAKGVDYNGPVVVKNIDVPAFSAPDNLAGREQSIIAGVLDDVQQTFADAGVVFTLDTPIPGIPYSTIYVGGNSSPFASFGVFSGLAEGVDVGNSNHSDNAFAFTGALTATTLDIYVTDLSALISHEAGHLLGYAHTNVESVADQNTSNIQASDNSLLADVAAGTITVISPNGGESWQRGTTHNITWSTTGSVSNVKIVLLSSVAGSSTLTASTPNDGSFPWSIPTNGVNAGDFKIYITDVSNSAVNDHSDNNFTLTAPPQTGSITVTSPNTGSEIWERGTTQNITWTSTGSIANVKIVLSDGTSETVTNSTPNDGSYSWPMPIDGRSGSGFRIYVSDTGSSGAADSSNNTFTVIPYQSSSSITVTSPNTGSEIWERGTTQNITWTSTGSIANVKIVLSDGTSETVTNSTPNDGSYSWPMPIDGRSGSGFRIYVSDTGSSGAADSSNNTFTVIPYQSSSSITVTSPNTGSEIWERGTTQNITWTSTGSIANVKIVLSDGTSETVTNSTPNDGSYSWPMPIDGRSGSGFRIYVSDTGSSGAADSSNNTFTVIPYQSSSSITVTSPNTGSEIWERGTTQNITWTSTGSIANVKIVLSDGTSETVTNSTPNDGSYSWPMPIDGRSGSGFRIYVSDTGSSGAADSSNNTFTVIPYPLDDAYEDNDSTAIVDKRPEGGTNSPNFGLLTSQKVVSGLKLLDGEDWYKFRMGGSGTSSDYVRIDFTQSQGDLDMILFNATTHAEVGHSDGTGNYEQISLNGLAADSYYIWVYGKNWQYSNPDYTLTIQPGTAVVDDAYEDNDSSTIVDQRPEGGTNSPNFGLLTSQKVVSGLKLLDGEDWYKFRMAGSGTSSDYVRIDFTHSQGDLDIILFNATTGAEVGHSDGTGNSEQISLNGLSADSYYIWVYGKNWQYSNPNYTLTVQPGTAPVDDAYEDNDSIAILNQRPEGGTNSPNFGLLTSQKVVSGLKLLDGEDWYKFRMAGSGTSSDYVRIDFTQSQGDLDMILFNATTGAEVGHSDGTGNSEQISLNGLSADSYYIWVYGKNWQYSNPNYTLTIQPGTKVSPDRFENNDEPVFNPLNPLAGWATNLDSVNGGPVYGTVVWNGLTVDKSGDDDWYTFTLDGGGRADDQVKIDFDNNYGNLDLYVYQADHTTLVGKSELNNNSEGVSLNGLSTGTYYVKVIARPGDICPDYRLTIVHSSIRDWTVICYLNGDNDLEKYKAGDLSLIMGVGSKDGVNVVALLDKNPNYDGADAESAACYATYDGRQQAILLSAIKSGWKSEVAMDDPGTLSAFVDYVIDHYPADHYLLNVSDHGNSWRGAPVTIRAV